MASATWLPDAVREGEDYHWYYYRTRERAMAALRQLEGRYAITYGGVSAKAGYEGMHYLAVRL